MDYVESHLSEHTTILSAQYIVNHGVGCWNTHTLISSGSHPYTQSCVGLPLRFHTVIIRGFKTILCCVKNVESFTDIINPIIGIAIDGIVKVWGSATMYAGFSGQFYYCVFAHNMDYISGDVPDNMEDNLEAIKEYGLSLWNEFEIPITYIPINSNLSGPAQANIGDEVEVDVSFPDGYKLKDATQGSGISVYYDNGYIDFTYDEATHKLRFTMPD